MSVMKQIRIEKITLNVGAGKDTKKLDNGLKLLKNITGKNPVKTFTRKRIPGWGLRPGLPIGCKITLRKSLAKKTLQRLLHARDFMLLEKCFDDHGSISFGVPEYIDIEGIEYDPEIGMMGLEVCVTLERLGYRIKRRRVQKRKIPRSHRVVKEDSIKFMEQQFKINVEKK